MPVGLSRELCDATATADVVLPSQLLANSQHLLHVNMTKALSESAINDAGPNDEDEDV